MVLRYESLDFGTEFKLYFPSLFEDVMSKNVLWWCLRCLAEFYTPSQILISQVNSDKHNICFHSLCGSGGLHHKLVQHVRVDHEHLKPPTEQHISHLLISQVTSFQRKYKVDFNILLLIIFV